MVERVAVAQVHKKQKDITVPYPPIVFTQRGEHDTSDVEPATESKRIKWRITTPEEQTNKQNQEGHIPGDKDQGGRGRK